MGESFAIAAGAALSAFSGESQHNRLMRLEFPLKDGPPAILLPNKLVAHEEVSRGFRFEVEVLSDEPRMPLKMLMGRMVAISLVRPDGSLRHFNGHVTELRFLRTDGGFAFYRMVLEPWLAFARLRKDSVSFHGKSVREITEETLKHYRQADWHMHVFEDDPRLTVANQHNETDYNHLHRRWEALGLHYWYEHRFDGHTLMLSDKSFHAEPIDATRHDGADVIAFRDKSGSLEDDGIREWTAVRRLGSGKTTLASFDYKNPGAQRAGFESANRQGDVFPYFESAWFRASVPANHESREFIRKEMEAEKTPPALLRPPKSGDTTIQIVRTQPEEQDKTIKELYFQATDVAADIGGYIYVENQYFQYEEWTQRLVTKCKANSALWKSGMKKPGQSIEDMPIIHVFIVAPVAERDQMVPRTYDALAVVGQQGRMTGQNTLIDDANKKARLEGKSLPAVVKHANGIAKPTAELLKANGLRVVASMLQVSGSCIDLKGQRRMRYREIYMHSKLMLINDSFFTLGSANLNVRSMAGDSELNLGTNDRTKATFLRKQIWRQLSGGNIDGADGSRKALKESFDDWVRQADRNRDRRISGKPMQGFILPIEDNRSSTIRLG